MIETGPGGEESMTVYRIAPQAPRDAERETAGAMMSHFSADTTTGISSEKTSKTRLGPSSGDSGEMVIPTYGWKLREFGAGDTFIRAPPHG